MRSGIRRAVFAWPLLMLGLSSLPATGQDDLPKFESPSGEFTSKEGSWENWRIEDGTVLARRVVKLSAAAEAAPALSIQLVPDDFHAKEGNAAILYLQAMGFFEQTAARKAKEEFETKNRQLALDQGQSLWPPHTWREMLPNEIPLEEAKEYLVYTYLTHKRFVERDNFL